MSRRTTPVARPRRVFRTRQCDELFGEPEPEYDSPDLQIVRFICCQVVRLRPWLLAAMRALPWALLGMWVQLSRSWFNAPVGIDWGVLLGLLLWATGEALFMTVWLAVVFIRLVRRSAARELPPRPRKPAL